LKRVRQPSCAHVRACMREWVPQRVRGLVCMLPRGRAPCARWWPPRPAGRRKRSCRRARRPAPAQPTTTEGGATRRVSARCLRVPELHTRCCARLHAVLHSARRVREAVGDHACRGSAGVRAACASVSAAQQAQQLAATSLAAACCLSRLAHAHASTRNATRSVRRRGGAAALKRRAHAAGRAVRVTRAKGRAGRAHPQARLPPSRGTAARSAEVAAARARPRASRPPWRYALREVHSCKRRRREMVRVRTRCCVAALSSSEAARGRSAQLLPQHAVAAPPAWRPPGALEGER
jgi:hypothetical protein